MQTRLMRASLFSMFGMWSFASSAQVICNNVGGTRVCNDVSGGYSSSATPLGGGTTVIRNSDGSHSTINQLDGTTVIRNSDGSSTRASHLGSGTVIQNSNGGGYTTVTPLGGGTVIRNSDGSHSTIVPLGNPGGLGNTGGGLGNPAARAGGNSNCRPLGMSVTCD